MKRFTTTTISIALAALATHCVDGGTDGGVAGAGGGTAPDAGAPDSGEWVPGGSGGSSAGGSAEPDAGGQGGKDEAEPQENPAGRGNEGGDDGAGDAAGAGGRGELAGAGGSTDGGADGAAGCTGFAGCGGDDATSAIHAVAWLQPDSCDRSVAYEVRDVRDEHGMPVTDYTCEWTFSDGGVANTCAGNKSFGGMVPDTHYGTVVVRDSATGATTTASSEVVQVIEPQTLEILATSFDPMRFEYDIDRQGGCGGTHTLEIQPAENILTPGPWSIHSQTLEVAAPGVYTLTYTVEGCAESYARTCVWSETAQVTVAECQ